MILGNSSRNNSVFDGGTCFDFINKSSSGHFV